MFTGVGPDGTKYKTAYKCEGEKLTISCAADQTIKVIIVMMMMMIMMMIVMRSADPWVSSKYVPS